MTSDPNSKGTSKHSIIRIDGTVRAKRRLVCVFVSLEITNRTSVRFQTETQGVTDDTLTVTASEMNSKIYSLLTD